MFRFVWRSKPSSHLRSVFRAIITPQFRRSEPCFALFGVQSHHHIFVRRSEPLSFLSFGVQSHHHIFVQRSEPLSLLSFNVQSHVSLSLTFRVAFSFSIQSHYHSSVSAFRAMFRFVWRSKPSSHLRSAFRAIITPQFDVRRHYHSSEPCFSSFSVQSHHRIFVGVQSHHFPGRCSEPSSHLRSAFRAIIITPWF